MTNLTADVIAKINKMNRSAQLAVMGTLLSTLESASATDATNIATLQANATVSASQVVTAVHTNASAITMDTGLGTVKGYVAQLRSSGSELVSYTENTSGSIVFTVNTNGSSLLTAGDIASYIAWA